MPLDAVAFETFALDRSVRHYDAEGRLHVAISPISKAVVNEYWGWEIPDRNTLGLLPDRKYRLYRDPNELAKAAPTFNNIQLLSDHIPVNTMDPQKDIVVGSTGTDADFQFPYLNNSLVVWEQQAISDIESRRKRQLSSAYRYRADMTPGVTPSGESYDGVMRDIRGNHVCLVKEGRAGDDVVVGDSKPKEPRMPAPRKGGQVSRQALLASGALIAHITPLLAADAKMPDLRPAFKGVTAKNWKSSTPKIAKAVESLVADVLAEDASIDNLVELLNGLEGSSAMPAEEMVEPPAAVAPPPPVDNDAEPPPDGGGAAGGEGSPLDQLLDLLQANLPPEIMEQVKALAAQIAGGGGGTEPPPEEKDDAPPPDAGGGSENPDDDDTKRRPPAMDKNLVTKTAMDAAIAETRTSTIALVNAIREAERDVRDVIGELPNMPKDATEPYRMALDSLGVDLTDVPPAAFKALFKAIPKRKEPAFADQAPPPPPAMDAKARTAFNDRWGANATRLKH